MTDRVYPSSKPTAKGTTAAAAAGGGNQTFPANKAQLYNASRPTYRPLPPPRRRRSCCRSCCLWTTLFLIIIILLVVIAGAIFWVLYRPHRPSFTVTTLQISQFNLTSTSLNSRFSLTVAARNPNKKITFLYDPMTVSLNSGGIDVGDGSFPAFEHGTKNTTTLKTVISSSGQGLDSTAIGSLRSDLKNKSNLPLKIQMDTKVKVKIGSLKTKKVGIRVICDGITATIPTGKSSKTATTSDINCKVDLRIKIWKWTF